MVAVDLIRDIFLNRINYQIEVKSLESLPDDKVKINVCSTLTLRNNSILVYNNIEYRVDYLLNNEYVVVYPDANGIPFSGNYIIVPKPLFLHGSPISVNNEYLEVSADTRDKTPFSWLLRGLRESRPTESTSIIEVSLSGRLFLMDEANSGEWTNDSHDYYAVNPMYNLAVAFEEVVKKSPKLNLSGNFDIIDRARFGVTVENKGSVKKIISDDLSGVEVIWNIDVYKHGCIC
jgi:hypothetical protein